MLSPWSLRLTRAGPAPASSWSTTKVETASDGEEMERVLIDLIMVDVVRTSLGDMANVGWRPAALMIIESMVVLVWVVGMLLLSTDDLF